MNPNQRISWGGHCSTKEPEAKTGILSLDIGFFLWLIELHGCYNIAVNPFAEFLSGGWFTGISKDDDHTQLTTAKFKTSHDIPNNVD